MSFIGMDLRTTKDCSYSIPVRQLDYLLVDMVESSDLRWKEPNATNTKIWGNKMRTLCQTINKLDHLTLHLPSLPGFDSFLADLPQAAYMDDPLSGVSLSLKTLTLNIPFCIPGPDVGRNGYWVSRFYQA